MSLLYSVMPEMVAEPLAWGEYKEAEEVYFFVCRFHEFSDGVPRVTAFPKLVAEFHRRSKPPGPAQSKTGKFGFDMITYGGRNPQDFPLCDTWEESFTRGLGKLFDLEAETHKGEEGGDDMQRLRKGIMDKVIPRLLRPLETEGRTLTPTLVHGDLWDGNASVDGTTGQSMFFDATPLWAHNESQLADELAPWWLLRHEMTDAYIEEYKRHYDPAEPSEDFESRGALYALAIATMEDLLSKFPLGYEGYASEKGLAAGADAARVNAKAFEANANISGGLVQGSDVTTAAGPDSEKTDRIHGEEWHGAKKADAAKVQL
ncbi:hypothetical protein N0V88_002819 [Collariella sp. IMI 366227]|nr:hypothetical protein N0V88_002819 [Collariella sp. IMI 366227]